MGKKIRLSENKLNEIITNVTRKTLKEMLEDNTSGQISGNQEVENDIKKVQNLAITELEEMKQEVSQAIANGLNGLNEVYIALKKHFADILTGEEENEFYDSEFNLTLYTKLKSKRNYAKLGDIDAECTNILNELEYKYHNIMSIGYDELSNGTIVIRARLDAYGNSGELNGTTLELLRNCEEEI